MNKINKSITTLLLVISIMLLSGCSNKTKIVKQVKVVKQIQKIESLGKAPVGYGLIKSKTTGRIWLDRNLGALRACVTMDDKKCFGDYYQYDRRKDGHEKVNSQVTYKKVNSMTHNDGKLVVIDVNHRTFDDFHWISRELRKKISNGLVKNVSWTGRWNPCPSGFRIPYKKEILAENVNTMEEVYALLKLPYSGYRYHTDGILKTNSAMIPIQSYKYPRAVTDSRHSAITFKKNRSYQLGNPYSFTAMPVRCINK